MPNNSYFYLDFSSVTLEIEGIEFRLPKGENILKLDSEAVDHFYLGYGITKKLSCFLDEHGLPVNCTGQIYWGDRTKSEIDKTLVEVQHSTDGSTTLIFE